MVSLTPLVSKSRKSDDKSVLDHLTVRNLPIRLSSEYYYLINIIYISYKDDESESKKKWLLNS